jgi:hypothetical protein
VSIIVLAGVNAMPSSADDATPDVAAATFTGSGEAGTGSASFRIGYYDNDDKGDGNPFLDEALTVIEPVVIVDYNVTDRLGVYSKFSYDDVTSASIERLSNFSEQSGASSDFYIGLDLGARYELSENRRVGGFVGGSVEYDYTSIGFGGDFAQDLAEKNATVKVSANVYFDSVDVIQFNGEEDGSANRRSYSATVSWYQIIDKRTHAETGATIGVQTGFLETAYNAVVIEDPADAPNPNLDNRARGTEVTEELPGTRVRGSVFGRARYSLLRNTALEGGGRLYADDWGIRSLTLEPVVRHWPLDSLGGHLGYRYYVQSAADDHDDHFTTSKSKRTQDSDLAAFDAHGIHGGISWMPWPSLEFNFDAGYTFREDGLDQLMLSAGARASFDARPLKRLLWPD